MPAKPDRKQVTSWLSPSQFDALKAAVRQAGVNQSAFIRAALARVIPDWPDDLPGQGEHERDVKSP